MSSEIRPTRYVMPKGDYRPQPAYRRPGSDHRHIPSLGEQLIRRAENRQELRGEVSA